MNIGTIVQIRPVAHKGLYQSAAAYDKETQKSVYIKDLPSTTLYLIVYTNANWYTLKPLRADLVIADYLPDARYVDPHMYITSRVEPELIVLPSTKVFMSKRTNNGI